MDNWILYSLAAALSWGTYSIIARIVTSEKYFHIDPPTAAILMMAGVCCVFVFYFLAYFPHVSMPLKAASILVLCAILAYTLTLMNERPLPLSLPVVATGVLQGILWAVGMVAVYLALSTGTPVGKIATIYNLNLLITILLGFLMLHEVPSGTEQVRLLVGGGLVILGAIIVGT